MEGCGNGGTEWLTTMPIATVPTLWPIEVCPHRDYTEEGHAVLPYVKGRNIQSTSKR